MNHMREISPGGAAPAVFTPRRVIRCKSPLRKWGGRSRWCGFVFVGTWESVLRCYDAGNHAANNGPGSAWSIWAANVRGERELINA